MTGFTLKEGQAFGRPRFPPTMVLNDYVAGYIGAAGILAALQAARPRRPLSRPHQPRACGDVVHEPRLFRDNSTSTPPLPEHRMIPLRTVKAQTPYGIVDRLAPR